MTKNSRKSSKRSGRSRNRPNWQSKRSRTS